MSEHEATHMQDRQPHGDRQMDHVHRLMGRGVGGGGGRKGIDFMSEWSEREADMQGKIPTVFLG